MEIVFNFKTENYESEYFPVIRNTDTSNRFEM